GMTGIYFNPLSNKAYTETDLLLSVGSRHEEFTSGGWSYFPANARFVQIDVDASEIGRNFLPTTALIADAKLALAAIAAEVRGRGVDQALVSKRKQALAEAKRTYIAEVAEEVQTEQMPIRTKRVVWELNQVFGENTILVNENGGQDLWSYYYPYYQIKEGSAAVVPAEQTCMGLGVVGAVAAKLNHPEKNVVCVTGDAAFQMYTQDLPTAVQYKTPVTWVVLNNNALGWPKLTARARGEKYVAVDFEAQPNFVQLAQAYGCHGEHVENPAGIHGALERALEANKNGTPAVVEFFVETWSYSWGFRDYYKRTRELPAGVE
ncbi:MAG: thiamine pyrophosphate-dependent enzyme, partial [Dehalococcoidales bacterium]|nr:thiamine pyrophosphate-dependent enzyme [Dehalococcoidales bacterium]